MKGSSLILPLRLTGAKNVQYRYKINIISPHSLIFPNDIKPYLSNTQQTEDAHVLRFIAAPCMLCTAAGVCVCLGGGGGGGGGALHINTLIVKLCNKNITNVISVLIESQYFPVWP